MMNKQITLYIGGTKQRQAGFADLAIIGVFPQGEFKNMDRVTLIAEKPVWSIKHTSDYILYHLIDRRVKSFDADANGVLSIAMTIPSNMQLADGKSPYTLLKTVYDKFRNEYMTPYSDGRDSFLDIKVDSESFQQIVAQYSLEPHKGRYVEMKGTLTGTLCVAQNKMEDLFRDSQYAEFANFKDIEIGTSCNSTMGLELLEIPRPVSYEIFVNGSRQPVSLSKPSDGYTTRLNDTDDYKYQNISFTLEDLMASENGIFSQGASSVKLDKENRRILCNVQKVEIRYKGALKFIGKPGNKDVVQRAVENGDVRISLGNSNLMDYLTSGLEFEIPFRLLRNSSFSITPNKTKHGLILSVMPSTQQEQQSITIEVAIREEEKKVIPPPVPVTRSGNKYGSKSSDFNKHSDKQKNQEEDSILTEEIKRRETEKRKKLLIIGFVVGFVSALILCCLGFGVYWMFNDNSDNDLNDQIKELEEIIKGKDNEINQLIATRDSLVIDWNKQKKELNDSIIILNKKNKNSKDINTVVSDSKGSSSVKNAKNAPQTIILNLIKEGKTYSDIKDNDNFNKLSKPEQWGVEALFLEKKGVNNADFKQEIKKKIPEINNKRELDWKKIKEIHKKIQDMIDEKKKNENS